MNGPRPNVIPYSGGFLPVWSVDGVMWRAVVMTRRCDEEPVDFVQSPIYPTREFAFAVAKRYCDSIGPIRADKLLY